MSESEHRIAALELDQKSIVRWSPQVEHERSVAIFDLLEGNFFKLADGGEGPYSVVLSLRESNIVFTITAEGRTEPIEIVLTTRAFRRVIKDYFMICDSYFQAIKGATPSRIEFDRHGPARPAQRRFRHPARRPGRPGRDRPRHRPAPVHAGVRAARPGLMRELPGSVLFACSQNAIRSPMAENIMRYFHGRKVFVQSAGVRASELDPFAVAVMDEIGIDLSRHRPRTFEQLDDDYFDVVISLSPEAQHRAVEMTRNNHCELKFWHMPDPSVVEGSRELRLDAYRALRDLLMRRIREEFPLEGAPQL